MLYFPTSVVVVKLYLRPMPVIPWKGLLADKAFTVFNIDQYIILQLLGTQYLQ